MEISLRRDNEGRLELDFQSDHTDIIYSEHSILDCSTMIRPIREEAEHIQSLRVSKSFTLHLC